MRPMLIALAAAGLMTACSPAEQADTKADIEAAGDKVAAETKEAGAEIKDAAKDAGALAKDAAGDAAREAKSAIHDATAPSEADKAKQH